MSYGPSPSAFWKWLNYLSFFCFILFLIAISMPALGKHKQQQRLKDAKEQMQAIASDLSMHIKLKEGEPYLFLPDIHTLTRGKVDTYYNEPYEYSGEIVNEVVIKSGAVLKLSSLTDEHHIVIIKAQWQKFDPIEPHSIRGDFSVK